MVHVTVGTDTYGRVKKVRGTPVVTKFAMLQFLPLYPIQSYYFFGSGRAKKGGVPFFATSHEATVKGIRLSRLDKTSVLIAYLRGIFSLLVVLGFLCFLFVIELHNGKELDVVQWAIFHVMLTMFIVGTMGGVLTYVVPLVPKRERNIRWCCGELLGIGVDPALVEKQDAEWIDEEAGNSSLSNNVTNQFLSREDCLHELISVRVSIAQGLGLDAGHLEARTDQLLERLVHSD